LTIPQQCGNVCLRKNIEQINKMIFDFFHQPITDKSWKQILTKGLFFYLFFGLIVLVIGCSYYLFVNLDQTATKKSTTIEECVSLSRSVRINMKTKKCFDALSSDEVLLLIPPVDQKFKSASELYNEIESYYDTRTLDLKQADSDKNEEIINKIINSNPDVFVK
jgi:hypothetical protein